MQYAATFLPVFRWTARAVGTSILAFVLLDTISGGVSNLKNIAPGERLLWGGFILSLAGFALLWKWELTGGIVALSGIVLFYTMNYALSGKLPGGWFLAIFFLPGIMSIVCWRMEHQTKP